MNGQVESANRVLLTGLKRRLEKAKGAWAEEVPRIVWAYHTTAQSSTMETPFSLVYGSDAMIPVEIHESQGKWFVQSRDSRRGAHSTKLECGQFKPSFGRLGNLLPGRNHQNP